MGARERERAENKNLGGGDTCNARIGPTWGLIIIIIIINNLRAGFKWLISCLKTQQLWDECEFKVN